MPVLYMTDWVEALKERGQIHRLYGGLADHDVQRSLKAFWSQLRKLIPEHEVFPLFDENKIPPGRCIPMYIHTDEGRGLKKTGVLVVSSTPCLGLGSRKQRMTRLVADKLAMNFIGETLGNRFAHVVCPKINYEKDPEVYMSMLAYVSLNCRLLLEEGFDHNGERWYVVYITSLGDWCAHVKNGNFLRHFGHIAQSWKTAPEKWKGICHQCGAGVKGLPSEDYRLAAACLKTIGLVEAWNTDGPLLELIRYRKNRHLAYASDVWHGWHLGWGRECVAGGCVLIVIFFDGDTMDEQVAGMNDLVSQYCRDKHEVLSFAAVTRGKLGWSTWDTFPKGSNAY
jgi:hypothetical protein